MQKTTGRLLPPGYHPQAGLTLVELMITIVVLAVVAGMAIPSFSYLVTSNAIASQTNHFAAAINLARSEAIKRNTDVIMCKRSGTGCDNNGQWEDGWVIFADNDADNSLDSGEEIQYVDALKPNYTLRASVTNTNWLSFQSDGRIITSTGAAGSVVFRLCAPDADNSESRAISLNAIGQARLSKGTTTCP